MGLQVEIPRGRDIRRKRNVEGALLALVEIGAGQLVIVVGRVRPE